jgi:dihydrofolate reductase
MGSLIGTVTMTVDAVTDPVDWYVTEGEHEDAARALFRDAAAMLLGRPTYEGLAAYWSPLRSEWADVINPMPKYVASRTLSGPLDWNATVIEGNLAAGVAALKDDLGGDLVMVGVGELARYLLGEGLVDELRFWVHPVVRGEGARPFEGVTSGLRMLEATTFDSGVTLLSYEPAAGP